VVFLALERTNAVTLAGNPVTLIGPELKEGNKAPDFEVLTEDRKKVNISSFKGKTCIITTVPSLDTAVCDMQIKRFNKEAKQLSDDVVVLTISADLPFAQSRWCVANGADAITVLSDHLDMSFGKAYGTYMKENRLECRAVFVIDLNGIVGYAEYVPEVTDHPDYDGVLRTVSKILANSGSEIK
jgi:thiol peroxidase